MVIEELLKPYDDLLEPMMVLTHLMDVDKSYLYAHIDEEVPRETEEEFLKMMGKLEKGYPIQYLIREKNFMGLDLYVDEGVLIPRNDTEVLVEYLMEYIDAREEKLNILEIGVGSGAISISLAKFCPNVDIIGLDISKEALRVAQVNIEKFDIWNIELRQSDLFEAIGHEEKFDIIVSNPPYIASKEIDGLMDKVKDYEPMTALDGGLDGLDFYRDITVESRDHLNPEGLLIYEIGYDQKDGVMDILDENDFKDIRSLKDYQANDRVVMGKKR